MNSCKNQRMARIRKGVSLSRAYHREETTEAIKVEATPTDTPCHQRPRTNHPDLGTR